MCPVTCAVPVLTVVVVTCCSAPTRTRTRILCRRFVPFRIHLVVLAYIRCVRMEHAVLAEVKRREITPGAPPRTVVNHNIGHHFRSCVMERLNQRFQFLTRAPVRVLVTVVLRMVSSAITVSTWRQPYIIEITAYLMRLRQ